MYSSRYSEKVRLNVLLEIQSTPSLCLTWVFKRREVGRGDGGESLHALYEDLHPHNHARFIHTTVYVFKHDTQQH